MARDLVGEVMEDWSNLRPDLDFEPLAVVLRINLISKHLQRRTEQALSPFGLKNWQFDLLAALRRAPTPDGLPPTGLMQTTILSSGAMTNRIDRLEEAGLVRRMPHPTDRRGLLVALTPKGRKLVDRAIGARMDNYAELLRIYRVRDRKTLARLLGELLVSLEETSDRGRGRARWSNDARP